MGIPCTAEVHFDLIDITASEQRPGKTGAMNTRSSPIFQCLGISENNWSTANSDFQGKSLIWPRIFGFKLWVS